MQFTLKAADLIHRRGFSDAMVFDDLLEENGVPEDLDEDRLVGALISMGGNVVQDDPEYPTGSPVGAIVLYRVVERVLMPHLVGFTLVFSPLRSNPVRLEEGWNQDVGIVASALDGVAATVSAEEVLAATQEVLEAYAMTAAADSSCQAFAR